MGTTLVLSTIDLIGKFIPPLRLRADEEEEVLGIDDVELGEFAVRLPSLQEFNMIVLTNVQYDYVEITRDVRPHEDNAEKESLLATPRSISIIQPTMVNTAHTHTAMVQPLGAHPSKGFSSDVSGVHTGGPGYL